MYCSVYSGANLYLCLSYLCIVSNFDVVCKADKVNVVFTFSAFDIFHVSDALY